MHKHEYGMIQKSHDGNSYIYPNCKENLLKAVADGYQLEFDTGELDGRHRIWIPYDETKHNLDGHFTLYRCIPKVKEFIVSENTKKLITPNKMSDYGILWAINKFFLHPLGLAMARDREDDIINGCVVSPDGKWEFSEDTNTKNKNKFKEFLQEFKKEHLYEKITFDSDDLIKLDEIQNKVLGTCDGAMSVGYKSDQQIYELCLELHDKIFRDCILNNHLQLDITERMEYHKVIQKVLKSYTYIINNKL